MSGHPLFPDLPDGPPYRAPQPGDRVVCPHCQGWGVFNFEDDGLPFCTLECGLCGGEGKTTRAEAEVYVRAKELPV